MQRLQFKIKSKIKEIWIFLLLNFFLWKKNPKNSTKQKGQNWKLQNHVSKERIATNPLYPVISLQKHPSLIGQQKKKKNPSLAVSLYEFTKTPFLNRSVKKESQQTSSILS